MARKRWNELSDAQKAATILGAAAQIALAAAAWADLARRPADQVRGPKAAWALGIAVNFVGPISYFTLGRRRVAMTVTSEQAASATLTGAHSMRSFTDGVATFSSTATSE
jgi:hypothetical protein